MELENKITGSESCIICVAITGSVPQKIDNPAVPVTANEQIESTQEAFDLSHIHQAVAMQADGRLRGPLYIQFVMGVKNAMTIGPSP